MPLPKNNHKLTALVLASSVITASPSWSQGVRGNPMGGGSGDLDAALWFWGLVVGLPTIMAIYGLFFGNHDDKKKSVSYFAAVGKGLFVFIGLPTLAHFIFGGGSAIFVFFGLLLLFSFTTIGEKIFGGEDKDE